MTQWMTFKELQVIPQFKCLLCIWYSCVIVHIMGTPSVSTEMKISPSIVAGAKWECGTFTA